MRGQVAYERAAFFSFEGLLHSRIFLISQHVRPTAFSESFDIIIATCEDPIVDARRGGGGSGVGECARSRKLQKRKCSCLSNFGVAQFIVSRGARNLNDPIVLVARGLAHPIALNRG
jgi:hypothetical protein